MNSYKIIGRLGQDPEVKYLQDGKTLCNFSVATKEYGDKTEWHRVVCFGKLAENCGQYLSKGREVYAGGRHQERKWEDKDGNTRYTAELVAHTVEFLGSKEDRQGQDKPAKKDDFGTQEEYDFNSAGDVPPPGADESDVPF